MNQDQLFMKEALLEAQKAFLLDEVPIGAVIVQDGIVIARGHNLRETGKNAAAHAELLAINEACSSLGGWRLPRCTLYVTLEPCPMCARIDRVVFGAYDPKAGSCGSLVNLFDLPYNHRPLCEGGVLETECAGILSEFFRQLRQKRKT